MKSKVTAFFLAFFMGGIGMHKFYLGRIFAGIMYMLFFWTLIPAFIAFFESLYYLGMSEDNFNMKYNGHLYLNR